MIHWFKRPGISKIIYYNILIKEEDYYAREFSR